ncbi:hypothetical protein mRhiFer1_009231 [Rhinolophus ferrumequinum]|uniref:Uncharacterized protein n=1 Tax=Rhinolophus ferrumequinum TaxID=59479 RepID=A0A7J7S7U9_RHIFE|nr:hypothetical protein mRhiFer1_009231 [Rhinolophus ferrumequinum]
MNWVSQTRDRGHLICLMLPHCGHMVGPWLQGVSAGIQQQRATLYGCLWGQGAWHMPLWKWSLMGTQGSWGPGKLKLDAQQSCQQEGQRVSLGFAFFRSPHTLSGEQWNFLVGESGEQCHLVSI